MTMEQFDRFNGLSVDQIREQAGMTYDQALGMLLECVYVKEKQELANRAHFYACRTIETAPWINRLIEAAEVAHYEG